MLSSLYIKNFALIDELSLKPGAGLNILTGETGAGKSLLVGALGLILGKRLDSSYIFNPLEKCIIEARFENIPPVLLDKLSESDDFDLNDDGIILRREATSEGKSRAFVNDTPVNLPTLKETASLLVDLHGQHENQQLLSRDFQLDLLDAYAGQLENVRVFGRLAANCFSQQRIIRELHEKEQEAKQQLDYFQFQFEELNSARLDPMADASLAQELDLLQNGAEIKEVMAGALEGLFEGDDSVYAILSSIKAQLGRYKAINPAIHGLWQRIQAAAAEIQDCAGDIEKIAENIDLDPAQLKHLEARNDLLNKLMLKFSVQSVEELVTLKESFSEKVGEFKSVERKIIEAEKELKKQIQEIEKLGLEIEKERKSAGTELAKEINHLLAEVGLKGADFSVQIDRLEKAGGLLKIDGKEIQPGKKGFNSIEFLISTNPGMPGGPIAKIASGGEISRVMLAIKAALATKADLSVLIFDEIDTGISGETARKVAKVMYLLAKKYQLIAITHLPQIAGIGDQHFLLFKENIGGKTLSRIRQLSLNERIEEVAKMISGADPTDAAIKNARELISSARI